MSISQTVQKVLCFYQIPHHIHRKTKKYKVFKIMIRYKFPKVTIGRLRLVFEFWKNTVIVVSTPIGLQDEVVT